MSMDTETRYVLVCDGCEARYPAAEADGALAARIEASRLGWKLRHTHPKKAGRRYYDYCPNCEVPA